MVYKLVLVGDGGVGKTAYVNMLLTGKFVQKYDPTLGVEVDVIEFKSNYGVISFNVWDTAGQEKYRGIGDGYYIGANCAIVMYDVTSRLTYKHVATWLRDIRRTPSWGKTLEDIPIVVCVNKIDVKDRKIQDIPKDHIPISVKSRFNFEEPFLQLAKKLTGHDDLVFM